MSANNSGFIAAIGMFDGVHLGHQAMIADFEQQAASRGLRPMVVTFEDHPLRLIRPEAAPPLLQSPERRAEKLQLISHGKLSTVMLPFTDRIRGLTAREFMQLLRDDYSVCAIYMGFNHRFGSDRLTDPADYRSAARELGMEIVCGRETRLEDGSGVSSSSIRRLLSEGRVAEAARALGAPYEIEGTVGSGQQLGRTIGFPTANLIPSSANQLIPARGVYACLATLPDGLEYPAMVNIGHRPTVDTPDHATSIEAHIIGYRGNLYGRQLKLRFIDHLRSEQRFPSIEALRQQLESDARATLAILQPKE